MDPPEDATLLGIVTSPTFSPSPVTRLNTTGVPLGAGVLVLDGVLPSEVEADNDEPIDGDGLCEAMEPPKLISMLPTSHVRPTQALAAAVTSTAKDFVGDKLGTETVTEANFSLSSAKRLGKNASEGEESPLPVTLLLGEGVSEETERGEAESDWLEPPIWELLDKRRLSETIGLALELSEALDVKPKKEMLAGESGLAMKLSESKTLELGVRERVILRRLLSETLELVVRLSDKVTLRLAVEERR